MSGNWKLILSSNYLVSSLNFVVLEYSWSFDLEQYVCESVSERSPSGQLLQFPIPDYVIEPNYIYKFQEYFINLHLTSQHKMSNILKSSQQKLNILIKTFDLPRKASKTSPHLVTNFSINNFSFVSYLRTSITTTYYSYIIFSQLAVNLTTNASCKSSHI